MTEDTSPGIEQQLARLGELERLRSSPECARGPWVVDRFRALGQGEPDDELAFHLAECSSCRELALVYREADAEVRDSASATFRIPAVAQQAVQRALEERRASPRRAKGLFRLRPWWHYAASAGLAAGVLLVLMPPASPLPHFFDTPVQRQYALPPVATAERPLASGERVWLHLGLKAEAYLYAAIAYTLGDAWTVRWIEPAEDPEDKPPRKKDPGPLDLLSDVPDGALFANCLVLAVPEALDAFQLATVKELVVRQDRAEAKRTLEELAHKLGGTPWFARVAHNDGDAPYPALSSEIDELFSSGLPAALGEWVTSHPARAAQAVAELLEEALRARAPSPDSEAFRRAAGIAQEWANAFESNALLERVATYRRWAVSPEKLAEKRRLDKSIRRDVFIYDDTKSFFLIGSGSEQIVDSSSVSFYTDASDRFRELHDPWGEIESLVRRAWFESGDAREQTHERVIRLSKEYAYPRGEALVRNHMAFAHQGEKAWAPAELWTLYAEAWTLAEDLRLWELASVAKGNLGFDCLKRGALGAAFTVLEDAARMQKAHGLDWQEGITLMKLSLAHTSVGRARDALPLAMRAARLLREHLASAPEDLPVLRLPLVRVHWYAAQAALEAGELGIAEELVREGEATIPSVAAGDDDGLSRLWNVRARTQLLRGAYGEALETARRAEAILSNESNPWREGQALATQGLALILLAREGEALATLERARSKLGSDVDARMDLTEVLSKLAALQERLGLAQDALASWQSWLQTVGELLHLNALNGRDQAILRERFRPGFVVGLAFALERSASAAGLELALNFLEEARPTNRFATGEPVGPTSGLGPVAMVDLQAALGARSAWLEYLLGEDRSFLLVVHARGARLHDLKTTKKEVESRLREVQEAVQAGAPVDRIELLGRSAFEILLGPAASDIQSCEELLVSLDPSVGTPLFDVLVSGDQGPLPGVPSYLLLDHAIAYVPSARLFLQLRRGEDSAPRGEGFLGLVGLATDEQRGEVGTGLSEIEAAADAFRKSGIAADVRRGDEADIEAVRGGLLVGHRYLHVLAHAHESAALELPSGGGARTELLEVSEIEGFAPLTSELVFLSLPGSSAEPRGISTASIDLPNALLFRGARAVAADLWRAPGAAHEELVLRFYRALLSGEPKAAALRGAKLALLRGDAGARKDLAAHGAATAEKNWSHPFHWASPVLLGESW